MAVNHAPALEARDPKEGDVETFENLEGGDVVTFFEWAAEPLTVIGREEDENVGEKVRVEAHGDESFLYEVDGQLWHYVPEEKYAGENNPFPVQNLRHVESNEA